MGLVFKMYANEWEGAFPTLSPYRGVWMIDLPRVYPEYMTHPPLLVCYDRPDHQILQDEMFTALYDHIDWEKATRIAADSYTYANWVVRDDSDVNILAQEYAGLPEGDYDRDIVTDQQTFYRLRDGVERLLGTESPATADPAATALTIPVMFDTVRRGRSYHKPPGSNVLYLDGHVEFLKYGERFPVTNAVADAFPSPGP
jgi:prepilin-type processing-associated H-X9-DG protein